MIKITDTPEFLILDSEGTGSTPSGMEWQVATESEEAIRKEGWPTSKLAIGLSAVALVLSIIALSGPGQSTSPGPVQPTSIVLGSECTAGMFLTGWEASGAPVCRGLDRSAQAPATAVESPTGQSADDEIRDAQENMEIPPAGPKSTTTTEIGPDFEVWRVCGPHGCVE